MRKIRSRLTLTTGVVAATGSVLVVAVATSVGGVLQSQQQAQALQELRDERVAVLVSAQDVRAENYANSLYTTVLDPATSTTGITEEQRAGFEAEQRKAAQAVEDNVVRLSSLATGPQAALVADMRKQLEAMNSALSVPVDAPPAQLEQTTQDYADASAAFENDVVELVATASAEVDALVGQAQDATRSTTLFNILAVLIGSLTATALTFLVIKSLRTDARRIAAVAGALREGDLTRSTSVERRDELGAIASSLDAALAQLRLEFTRVDGASTSLDASATELRITSSDAAQAARAAGKEVLAAGGDIATVTTSLQTVAAASEQMGASIREIATSATQATDVASQAVRMADHTNQLVSKLGVSSAEIGDVVKVITAIAEQTNLLALNATIEAARAGEMGKGFAVVAGEVKELAQQTGRATEDIARRVSAIQADTSAAVEAIGSISSVIAQVDDLQTTIASAVEEQSASTSEISRAIGDAADGADRIAKSFDEVSIVTEVNGSSVEATASAAAAVHGVSGELRKLVERFTF